MDFAKLVHDAQLKRDFAASKLPINEWFGVKALEVAPSAYTGECVKATLDTGDRVILPSRLSKALAPHVVELKEADGWALRYVGSKEGLYNIGGDSAERLKIPLFEMKKRQPISEETIDLDGSDTTSADESAVAAAAAAASSSMNIQGPSRSSGSSGGPSVVRGGTGGEGPIKQVGGGKRKRRDTDLKKLDISKLKIKNKNGQFESHFDFLAQGDDGDFMDDVFTQIE